MALYRPNAKNILHKQLSDTGVSAELLSFDAHKTAYGIISDVDIDTSQVKVKLILGDMQYSDKEVLDGQFLPLINSLKDIYNRFGSLRKGLLVRLHWTGRLDQKNCKAEVIAGEDSSLLRKDQLENEIDHGAYKLFSGGAF